jgi:hypothetical protein
VFFCRFVLLVLESARIEVAVLLNELSYLKYESSKTSQTDEAVCQKQRNLAILFSLIERIIKMISNASSSEGMFPSSCLFFIPWVPNQGVEPVYFVCWLNHL